MAIALPPAKVLVTGVNGYLGMWIVRTLLEQGYSVRATVRVASKGMYVLEYFQKQGFRSDKLEIAIVDDITKPGAFNEAVSGVDAIVHSASPISVGVHDPEVFIKPAIQGTTGILQSAFEFGSNIKRVVITSSGTTVLTRYEQPATFSEEDWNADAVEDVEKNGSKSKPGSGYRASKVLAERAAWKFYEKNKSKLNWDLTVVIPPVLLRPGTQEIPGGPSDLNASFKWLYETTVNTLAQTQEFLVNSSVWVDVRDAARGHMLALQKEDAGGERIIVSTGPFVWQDLADAASTLNPWPLPNHPAPKGNPELKRTYFTYFMTEKRERILGMVQSEMKTMEESVKDALEDFAQRGW
ncbi:hypothetical protein NP233_g11254 [Leucocoprinus birnbaumii]|uniref:NAD-dependent epimerase/dehydratase domain-containing protein n=1 Tax=Leucocoprinus birnbaumii TaxID=56174 RepID=A0AAD5VKL1_9AGAR|nr:hypothetical protein NP233_g11254 [Leucocoprinus birnbaumii]